MYPKIDAGLIVWTEFEGSDEDIFLYDVATGETTRITNNGYNDVAPQIDAGRIVWHGYPGPDAEIFLATFQPYACRFEPPEEPEPPIPIQWEEPGPPH